MLPLAFGIGAAAFYVLVTEGGVRGPAHPLDDIGEASRQSLDRVLRDAERVEADAR